MTGFILTIIKELIRFLSLLLKSQNKENNIAKDTVVVLGEEEIIPEKTLVDELYETDNPDEILNILIEHEEDLEAQELLKKLINDKTP